MWKQSAVFSLMPMTLLVGSLYLGLFGMQLAESKQSRQPNIIVIMADDLGWNDVSFHGADQIPTPNIDALAYNGVILQRHYVLPICTPSRTAFLTGYYAIRTGMQGYPLVAGEPRGIPLNNTLLPEHLKKLGYSTHLLGKWHVGYPTERHTPAYRGFDAFFGYYSGYIKYFNHTIFQNGHTGYDLHNDVFGNLSVEYNYKYMTDLITEKAEDIISTHDQAKPLYLQISHLAAHCSDAEDILEVRNLDEMNRNFGYIKDVNRRRLADVIVAMDQSVGRVVQSLRKANMLENSIIIFMSDNGAPSEGLMENFGSNYPLRGQKMTLWEGGIRGVACIYSPLIKQPSRVSNELFHITDWLPTLYSAAGGNPADLQVDGIDQWQTLTEDQKSNREAILLNIDEDANCSAALNGRFKLLQGVSPQYRGYYGDSGNSDLYPTYDITNVINSPVASAIANITGFTLEKKQLLKLRNDSKVLCERSTVYMKCSNKCLFDIQADPCETTDLATTHPEIVAELSNFIENYRAVLMPQTNAPMDPASAPENFGGVWMPWIKDTESL